MTTIPASQIVNVTPNVLAAGGNQLDLIGLMVTQNTRVPIGAVQPFATVANVNAFFGATSHEALMAQTYFTGFNNANGFPGSILYAQMPATAVAAYIRSGNISALTIPQLQAVNGTLTIIVDGISRTASINLASASSFSAAASLIQTGLNAAPVTQASITGSIGSQTAQFTGSISGNVLTVSAITGGSPPIVDGGLMGTAGGVAANTIITGQLSGATNGSVGTYAVSIAQAVNNLSMTEAYGLLSVGTVGSGTISLGQTVTGTVGGSAPTAGTIVYQFGTASGTVGTYYVNGTATFTAVALTVQSTPVTVTFDSVSGAFVITSGATGAESTVAFATGSAATSLLFTQATGAVLSQGSDPLTPGAFMAGVVLVTDNWSTFTTAFDPDFGNGATQKLLFALWTSQGAQNQNFAYITWDTDPTPTTTVPASSSFGQQLIAGNYTGTCVIWQPSDQLLQCFVMGAIAAIDFDETNGRITLAFKSQSGLTASVTNASVAQNLIANGYNFYGAYATANQTFTFLYPGSVSGPFKWLDSYVNQIWLNNNFQLDLMVLLTQVKSIPYNPAGFSLIEAALGDTINAGLNFGAFRAGVTLSSLQIAEVNSAAGLNIATVLNQRGWYLQVLDPGPVVREARGSPNCTFWYMDGEAVQQINLTSVDIL